MKALNSFVGSVAIAGSPSYGLTCSLVMPPEVRESGNATVSCSATAAGEDSLTLTGTSGSLTHQATATLNFVDFAITASSPAISKAGSPASSNVIIGSLNAFVGTVSLTVLAPTGLACEAINPNYVLSSGTAAIFCNATIAGTYVLTVTGTCGPLTHSIAVTFTFFPDFTITATPSVSFTSGSTGTSTVSIGGNPFGYSVTLSDQVSPSSGLTVAFNPPTLYQGESTVTFRSSTPGS